MDEQRRYIQYQTRLIEDGLWVQAMRKKLPPPENLLSQPGPSQNGAQDFLAPEDYVAQDEIFKVRQPLSLITFA
jgi:hypothetical protein